VPGMAVGRAAVQLPWLCPSTESLVALAEAPGKLTGLAEADPALTVFLLRFASPEIAPRSPLFPLVALESPNLPSTAVAYLSATTAGVLPTGSFVLRRVQSVARLATAWAKRLSEQTRRCPAEAAATVTRIAPLGWYAVAAVDRFAAAVPLAEPAFAREAAKVQSQVWGLDQASITRRLAARWRLPDWVAEIIGSLSLPFPVAQPLVRHPDLFAVVQLSVMEAEARLGSLGLTENADRKKLLDHLGLDGDELTAVTVGEESGPGQRTEDRPDDPHHVPLVRNLLQLAVESRRRNGPALVARLEDRIDELYRAAVEAENQHEERLRAAKLAALAELAAGAGHEINNPLAIISGNAQRLIRTEPDPERGEALRVILRQTERIAGILRDLMRFARPPRPEPRPFRLTELFEAVSQELRPVAREHAVELRFQQAEADCWLIGDFNQIRHALAAVVRNGIEAVGCRREVADKSSTSETLGIARVEVSYHSDGMKRVELVVRDSGPGMEPEVAKHAFDPFYSGRSAGRGRGLGLPTAWRLVTQNGGDLRYDPQPETPSRFCLVLSCTVGPAQPTRLTA